MEYRQSIVEKSLDLFLERGCRAITMDEIASANGVSKRTLYELFKDKSGLLDECLILLENNQIEEFERVKSGCRNMIDFLFTSHSCNKDVVLDVRYHFFKEIQRYYPLIYKGSVKRLIDFHRTTVLSMIREGQEQGVLLPELDPLIINEIVINMHLSLEKYGPVAKSHYSLRDMFRYSIIYYCRGISTSKGMKIIDKYLQNEKI